jgi:hypothetical protein
MKAIERTTQKTSAVSAGLSTFLQMPIDKWLSAVM